MRSSSSIVLVAALVGCASAPPARPRAPAPVEVVVAAPPPAPSAEAAAATPAPGGVHTIAPLEDATCVIHDTEARFSRVVDLSLHGKPFARFSHAKEVELRASNAGATLTVSDAQVSLTGEVSTTGLTVRARQELVHDGWIEIEEASTRGVEGSSLALRIETPAFVTPPVSSVTLPCSAFTLGLPSRPPAKGKRVAVKGGVRTPLRRSPKGAIVATVVTPKRTSANAKGSKGSHAAGQGGASGWSDMLTFDVHELRRRGSSVEVRIAGSGTVARGWIDASAVVAYKPSRVTYELASIEGMALLGVLTRGEREVVRTCPRDTPLYVRDGDDVVSVGVLHAHASFREGPTSGDEVRVVLTLGDLGSAKTLPLFARAASLEGCVVQASAPAAR